MTTTAAANHLRHHVRGSIEAQLADQAKAGAPKHERILLKKLHSLKNQLFCGFKSFTVSDEQTNRPRVQAATTTTTTTTKKTTKTPDEKSDRSSKLDDANKKQPADTAEMNFVMTVDQRDATYLSSSGGRCSSRSSRRGSKSSSLASLTNQPPRYSSVSDQESSHLAALLANQANDSAEDSSSRVASVGQHICSFKRASFRRLTGRAAKQTRDEQSAEKKMIELIRQLDRLAKVLGDQSEQDEHQTGGASCDSDDVFYLEQNWTDFVRIDSDEGSSGVPSADNSDSESKLAIKNNLKIQQDAIWELLTSEVFYLKRLRVILNSFLETLARLQQNSLLLEIDPARMTSNIGEVYQANYAFWTNHLLPMLIKSRLSNRPLDPSIMKGAFVKVKCLFSPYYKYCLEHTACLDYLRDINKRDQYFKVYLAWCESQKDCERLRLMDLLAKPMQRLTKYPLLLKAIYRRTQDPRQQDNLKQMTVGMERFVLTVDLRLRDRDECEQLHSTADRIETLDIGSSDSYCDEVNRIIAQYCRTFQLCAPLFDCSHGCNRRLIFDSSQCAASNLGQLKFKDSQVNSKLDIVLLLFTDQLLICKQVSTRWYAAGTQSAQERSMQMNNFTSSIYNSNNSQGSKHRCGSKKLTGSPRAGWVKSRSGSGNHLVDSLILATDRVQSESGQSKTARLLSAHNSGGSDQRASFHLSTSSLAGNVAREHFVGSKSADDSRSGDNLVQLTPTRRQPTSSQHQPSSRLKLIRSPFPIDRLVLHELKDGNRIFCCQLNDSNTIAASFILYAGHSIASSSSETPLRSSPKSDHDPQQQQHHSSLRSSAAIDSNRVDGETVILHHLSPLSGISKRSKSGRQEQQQQQPPPPPQISPARKLINLIEQTQLIYRFAASFHRIPLALVDIFARQQELEMDTLSLTRRGRLDPSPTKTAGSELLNSGERPASGKDDGSLEIALQESDISKAILEQEQSMLVKHGRIEDLQSCKSDYLLDRRHLSGTNLEPHACTSSLVSPLLSVSFDDSRILCVPGAISQTSVFEASPSGEGRKNMDSQTDPESQCTRIFASNKTRGRELAENSCRNNDGESLPERTLDRRRGQSWSCCEENRKPLPSVSGSELDSTASDISPLGAGYLNFDHSSTKMVQKTAIQPNNHRRQANHLRRQNDIISQSHDQHENLFSGSLQFSQTGHEPSSSVDETDTRHSDLLARSANNDQCSDCETSQANESIHSSVGHRRSSRYLSLARRLMQEQNVSSQSTTIDQTSPTLNDTQLESVELEEGRANTGVATDESGKRLSFCAPSVSHSVAFRPNNSSRRHVENHSNATDDQIPRENLEKDIFLQIPSRVQEVNDGNSDGSCRRNLHGCSDSGEGVAGYDRYRPSQFAENQPGVVCESRKFEKVNVPVLNVTNADYQQPNELSRESLLDDTATALTQSASSTDSIDSRSSAVSSQYYARPRNNLRPADSEQRPLIHRHTKKLIMASPKQGKDADGRGENLLQPIGRPQEITSRSLDADSRINLRRESGGMAFDCPGQCSNGSLDGNRTSVNHGGNLLELRCIHRLIQQDERRDNECGRVYLGFYEKLDLHLQQTSGNASCYIPTKMQTLITEPKQFEKCAADRLDPIVDDLRGPDYSASKRVRSLRLFTNDLIGSLLRATSSCSVYSKE